MTVDQMLKSFEGYYKDQYGEVGIKIMTSYLSKFSADFLPYLYAEALKCIGRNFKSAPGVAELERVREKARVEKHADDAKARALNPPDRLQIAEDIADPNEIASILSKLAAGKKVDG